MGIGVIATLRVAEGQEQAFEDAFAELARQVREQEPGNDFYALFRVKGEERTYKVLERYADQAAMDAHGRSEHFRAAGAKLAPCMAAPPEIELLDGV